MPLGATSDERLADNDGMVSLLPQWLNDFETLLSLVLAIAAVLGWILGGQAPDRQRPPDAYEYEEEQELGRREPVTVLGEIRNLLFHWIMRPDIPVRQHVLIVAGLVGCLLLSIWTYLNFDPTAGFALTRFNELLQTIAFTGIWIIAALLVFSIARLRWRIDYENRR